MTPAEHAGLWARDPRATAFQSPAWLEAWWTHLGGGERVDLEARDGAGRLIGALPAFIWIDGGVRKLVPVGAGHSDYLDALIDPDQATEAMAGLWRAAQAVDWDEIFLPDLRPDTPLLGPVPDGWTAIDQPCEICPVLNIPAGGDVLGALSKSRRRKIVHDRHRADRLGGVTATLAAPDELEEALEALFRLHGARWQAAGEPGVLADPKVEKFTAQPAPSLMEAGLLRVALVRHEGRIVFRPVRLCRSEPLGELHHRHRSFRTGPELRDARLCLPDRGRRRCRRARVPLPARRGGIQYRWGAQPMQTTDRVVRRG
jgi:CelD/BcsL family acetyltransferase involved in cellulose biosynthesis